MTALTTRSYHRVLCPPVNDEVTHRCMTSIVCVCVYDSHSGVMPFTVTAGHPILSSSVPPAIVGGNAPPYDLHSLYNMLTSSAVPLVTLLHSPHISAAHGTHHMTDNPWLGPPNYQCMGSGSRMQVPATGPVLNQHESQQYFSPAMFQIQPQFNSNDMQVPGAQGLAPAHECVSRHGSGVEQQQPMSYDRMGASSASGDLANTNAGNTMLWTGTLSLNGVCTQARALKTESIRDPYVHSFHETSINLTSMQKAISVAIYFVPGICRCSQHFKSFNARYPGLDAYDRGTTGAHTWDGQQF